MRVRKRAAVDAIHLPAAGHVLMEAMEGMMTWVTFETAGKGLLKVQARHVVAIYDELGMVKLSTVAGGVHVLAEGLNVQAAAKLTSDAAGESFGRRNNAAERWLDDTSR